jgi:Ca-activated chloride channel family protein
MFFTSPWLLLLLLSLPFIVWLGWPSRGRTRTRETVSLLLRLLIAVLLIVGLAGLEIRRGADGLSVVYLVDHSDSMPAVAQQVALDTVRQALQTMGPHDKSAVVVFGGDAVVERPLSDSKNLDGFTSKVSTIQTDLADAIRLGMALLPADTARRMVILSDGIQTSGDAVEAARLAAASGVQILVVPFADQSGSEAIVTSVTAPAHLRQSEQFGLEVTVDSTIDQAVGVRVLAGPAVAYEGSLQLRRGTNPYVLPMTAGAPGFAQYRVQIVPLPANDTFYQNNELAAFSQIAGPPRVLLVKNPRPRDGVDESRELIAGLAAANIQADVADPSGLPSELPALSAYVSVILVDVPANDLSSRQMSAIQTYVRDLGGGLVAVGGPSSYGVGGYYKTLLEATLPVDMQIKDQKRRPRLTLVFIIDKSGSMGETSGGVTKVELAKEAAIRSLDLLAPTDKVGVIAFDDTAAWVMPITGLDQHDAIVNGIGTIRADGGTSIMAGVRAASQVLPGDDGNVKHIILLTDGGADPTGIAELVKQMHDQNNITFSTVGVGQDAAAFLPDLAAAGGGLYHFAADPASIPAIFTEETTLATRSYIIEEQFSPQQVSPSPILAGITSVPSLLGYIGTTAKDSAQTILISGQKDPILASWQYGLGHAVAWTSDATGRWSKNWVTWENFARFWAQLVRSTINNDTQSNVEVRVQPSGDQANVTVDAQTQAGTYLNGLNMRVNVVAPDGATQSVGLAQVAPGRYTGTFTPSTQGAYMIAAAGNDPSQPASVPASVAQTAGWVMSYSPEYQTLTADPNFLSQIAALAGGHVLGKDASEIYLHNLPAPRAASRPAWPVLLLIVALLLPLDIAVRRFVVGRSDFQRAWRRLQDWAARLRPEPVLTTERAQRLSPLFAAKDRAHPTNGVGQVVDTRPAAPPAQPVSPILTRPATAEPAEPQPAAHSAPKPAAGDGQAPMPVAGGTSATLLAKKRAREKKE